MVHVQLELQAPVQLDDIDWALFQVTPCVKVVQGPSHLHRSFHWFWLSICAAVDWARLYWPLYRDILDVTILYGLINMTKVSHPDMLKKLQGKWERCQLIIFCIHAHSQEIKKSNWKHLSEGPSLCGGFKDIAIYFRLILFWGLCTWVSDCLWVVILYWRIWQQTFILMPSLWTCHISWHLINATWQLSSLSCSNCAKSLNHQRVDTALTQPDHRLIHKINNPLQTSCIELLIPALTLVFPRVISHKLSLAVVAFTFTSFRHIADKEIISPGL